MKGKLGAAVLVVELLGFGLLAAQAGMLMERGSPHWLGYVGSALVVFGAIVWGKLIRS